MIAVFLVFLSLLFFPDSAHARTLSVGKGAEHSTIINALEKAKDGDVIEVKEGIYRDKLVISKKIHLKGINEPVLRIPAGKIIEIKSSDVTVEGFVFEYDEISKQFSEDTAIFIHKGSGNVTVRDNNMKNVMFGVWNIEGRNLKIEDNIISGLSSVDRNYRGNCVNLTGSQNVHVINNNLSHCRDGIYMELCHDAVIDRNEISHSRYAVHTMWVDRGQFNNNTAYDNLVGLAIMYTDYSEIISNVSVGNQTHGLLLIQVIKSKINDNISIGNTKGIFLYNSVYNEIKSNLVVNNQLGIHSWGGSEDNTIFQNSFIGNEIQVKYVASKDQVWDRNYWSDYVGWDMSADGIGDYQYESNSVVDHIFWRYPIAKILYASPALHVLWMLEKQFPLIDVPKVVDHKPMMQPFHENWKEMKDRYSAYVPQRYYGEIEKLPHAPGGGL